MSFRGLLVTVFLSVFLLGTLPSCNNNKIACPTYKDSFPDSKKKKKKPEPQMPQSSKPRSSVLPPGYGKKK
jgi:hypothetical protein